MNNDSISQYDYQLPSELIAQFPTEQRDASRLLVLHRETKTIEHRQFTDFPEYLNAGDLLVMNNTRVVPAKLSGVRTATGGKWEGLFLREETGPLWRLIGQTRGKLQPGETITLHPPRSITTPTPNSTSELIVTLIERDGSEWLARPESPRSTLELLSEFGSMPLPPYMQREAELTDWERYQTIYAEQPGAVAAPTAGLHFTPDIMQQCRAKNVNTALVTLHVGMGTFRPVSVDRLSEHEMHSEWCELPDATAQAIQQTQQNNGRIIAIGTTTVRTLESMSVNGTLTPGQAETNLFIRPPYSFQTIDAMVTNFHLPKSTLLVLVSTFADRDFILQAYEEAIREQYRFFSYGDAMLIL